MKKINFGNKKMIILFIAILFVVVLIFALKKYKKANSPYKDYYILKQEHSYFFGDEEPTVDYYGSGYFVSNEVTSLRKGKYGDPREPGATGVITTDPKIRFGIFKLGVGSPKWKVKLAYLPYSKVLENNSKEYGIISENEMVVLTFCFDDNDVVEKVSYGRYP